MGIRGSGAEARMKSMQVAMILTALRGIKAIQEVKHTP